MKDPNLTRKAIHLLVLIVVVQSIMAGLSNRPAFGQEPLITDIGSWRRTANWTLDNPGYYTTENLTFQGGDVDLALNGYYWNESTPGDFSDGTWDDNITITSDGNLTLKHDDTNLVQNGDFSTGSDWGYTNGAGGNVLSERDGLLENAHLHHYDGPGPYLLFEDFETPGNWTIWTNVGVGANVYPNNTGHLSSRSMDIGWTPLLPTDDGGARKSALTSWDWSPYNKLGLWVTHENVGASLSIHINVIDASMASWASGRQPVANITGWRMFNFDLAGAIDYTQIKSLEILFDGLPGDGTSEVTVTIDDIHLFGLKAFDETSYANQTFSKSNWTDSTPGSVGLSFDVAIEDELNIAGFNLSLSVSNSTSSYKWEKTGVAAPYQANIVVDVGWLLAEPGNYDISLQLRLSIGTRLETRFSSTFDNISIVAPNRRSGTYLSDPRDTLSESIWGTVFWGEGPADPETDIRVSTRTGNSSNTSDGSWSGWDVQITNSIMSLPNRYIQYRVDLNTTNASKGPILTNISLSYDQYSPIGIIETDNFTVPDLHSWEVFEVDETILPETEIFYYFSADQGNNWVPTGNGANLSFVTNNTIRLKAELKTSNTTFSPRLLEMRLTYEYTGPLDHIHMSDSSLSTTANTTLFLSAWGHDILHRNVSFTQKWETDDPVGSVDAFGNYTAGMVGSWRVYCNNTADTISNWTTVDVSAGALIRIGIDPWDPGTLTADDQLQFNATGYDVMDNPFAITPNWSVSGGMGTVDPGPSATSLFQATQVGTGRVSITDGVHSNETNLFSVIAGQLASIDVTPSPKNLLPDQSFVFNAAGYDGDGNDVPLTSTIWDTNAGTFTGSTAVTANFTAQSTELMGGYVRATQGSISGEAVVNIDDTDDPPQIQGAVPDQLKVEDHGTWTLDLSSFADDQEDNPSQLKWRVTGDDPSLYTVAGEDQPGNHVLTFSTKQDAFGNNEISLWLVDTRGQTDQQSLWVNITPVNDRPSVFAPDKVYVRFDVPNSEDYSSYVDDVDNPIGDLTISTDDPGHTSVQGLQITYDYPESMVGEPVFVILTVSDGLDEAQDVVEVVVTSNYPPRSLTPIPDIIMDEDEILNDHFDLNDYFEDPDDSQLTFGSLSQKVGIDIDSSGLVSLHPEANWYGDELVMFSATDSSGAVAFDPVSVRVLPINDPPSIAGLPDITIHYDITHEFDVSSYISDVDNLISELTIFCSDSANTTVQGTKISFTYLIETTVVVTVTVSDGELQDSDIMEIRITDNNPPVSKGLPDVFFNEDEALPSAFDLDDYFNDLEGDTLTYSVNQTQSYVQVSMGIDNVVSFSSLENWSGQQIVVFRAIDEDGAVAEDSIIVTVIPVNDAPVISPITRQSGEKNKAWLLDLTSYIFDSDNKTDDLRIESDFEYVIVAGHFLIFNCEESFDSRVATASVNDGLLQDFQQFEVSVTAPVDPSVEMYIWPTSIGVILLGLVGLLYWRASKSFLLEDLFVIGKDGKLRVHKTTRSRPDRDEDLFSGMLTVIRDFAEDTFREEKGTLKAFELEEDKKVIMETAEGFYVAAIFSGKEPRWAAGSLEAFSQDMETMYGPLITSWSGAMDELGDLPDMADYFINKRKYSIGDWQPTEEEQPMEDIELED
jgi:hypothetical protein